MLGVLSLGGKTTAIAALARHLSEAGLRVGLLAMTKAPDSSRRLCSARAGSPWKKSPAAVSAAALIPSSALPTKFSGDVAPEVFLAEPVGSCTDRHRFRSPQAHLRRSLRHRAPECAGGSSGAARILGLEPGRPFSEKVVYIYTKQLEEADIIVLNKCDSIEAALRDRRNPRRALSPGRSLCLFVPRRSGPPSVVRSTSSGRVWGTPHHGTGLRVLRRG